MAETASQNPPPESGGAVESAVGMRRTVLDSPGRVRAVLGAHSGAERVALAVATDRSGRGGPVGDGLGAVGFCFRPGVAYCVPFEQDRGAQDGAGLLDALRPLLGADGPPKVVHDAKPALVALGRHGVEVGPLEFDTALAAFLLNEPATRLDDLAAAWLGGALEDGGRAGRAGDATADAATICARADATLRLAGLLEPELAARGQLDYLRRVELPLVPVLAEMELAGIAVDAGVLAELSGRLAERLRALEAEMRDLAGYPFNPRSPQQLSELLYERLGLERTRKTATGYATDAATLEALADRHPIVALILEHRQLARLKDGYVDALPRLVDGRTGRVHTHFSQTATSSGRIASSDPNLQNIPVRTPEGREVRRAFIAGASPANAILPGPTVLLSADYAQFELRILAHVTGEPRLREAFARDEDIHAVTAAELYGVPVAEVTAGQRRVGKTVNYGVIYGMSGFRLARETGLERRQAAGFVKRYRERYPGIQAHFERTVREAEERGYAETPLGRRRYLPDLRSPNRQRREAARRAAESMPNQGLAADIIKGAMIAARARLRERGLAARLLLQVHDELLLEAPEGELAAVAELVRHEMRHAADLDVPLKVEVKYGRNWGEMRPLGD